MLKLSKYLVITILCIKRGNSIYSTNLLIVEMLSSVCIVFCTYSHAITLYCILFISFSQIPHQRPPSGKAERPRPVYGKKQFENTRNAPATGAPRSTLGGYTQSYGTITASGLQSIQARKW